MECQDCQQRKKWESSFDTTVPYKEYIIKGDLIREFSNDVPEHLLKWHWDEEDRIVTPINKNDWKFQFDNELPIPFNQKVKIKAGVYHRIIKGSTDLKIKIEKNEKQNTNI